GSDMERPRRRRRTGPAGERTVAAGLALPLTRSTEPGPAAHRGPGRGARRLAPRGGGRPAEGGAGPRPVLGAPGEGPARGRSGGLRAQPQRSGPAVGLRRLRRAGPLRALRRVRGADGRVHPPLRALWSRTTDDL